MQADQEGRQSTAGPATDRSGGPAVVLPKGGGAIAGIGETFAANPVTGTASLTIPIVTSPGRAGFGPQLSLAYDSGHGNGPFGFGWTLAQPSITRKTDKGLPRYDSALQPDVFLLSGVEDLIPALASAGDDLVPDTRTRRIWGRTYRIDRFRPRIEGGFARIERWTDEDDPQDVCWRTISKVNVTTWYGRTAESRIADPSDPSRTFSWLVCESHDDRGNVMAYWYKAEDSSGVNVRALHERNRTDATRSANRYLKRIRYGNRTPYFADTSAPERPPLPEDWLFEVVFDYGEHQSEAPAPDDDLGWPVRPDPFSRYRAGFELRTYRICQRVLMFHRFEELGADACLVTSTDFTYTYEADPAAAANPVHSFLLTVTACGYRRLPDRTYVARALPSIELEYSAPAIDPTVREVDPRSLEHLPAGLDPSHVQWIDLDGEGLPGALVRQGGAWLYTRNESPIAEEAPSAVQFAALGWQTSRPSIDMGGRLNLVDLAGDGQLDAVEMAGPTPGFYERAGGEWTAFTAFDSRPVLDWRDPNLRLVDLTGDGHADVLITEQDAICWHASLGEAGFGPAERVRKALDEEQGPTLVFAGGAESIYLADMDGDGLTDLVRIRNGDICYWPNLGYGRFGPKVAMDNAPWFDAPDAFDEHRLRLGDVDGSGCLDVLYVGRGGVDLYYNQSGNGWSGAQRLPAFPTADALASVQVVDLAGNGTACLVWSSPLPGYARSPLRYIDLMGGRKPHLLTKAVNNLGAETRLEYAPSTKFYLADALAGRPWITRLPFSVQVVERIETRDRISGNRFVTRYEYHHGCFDGVEREFRGFGRVDQWDTEEIALLSEAVPRPAAANLDPASHVPPVLTRTWYHTGVYLDARHVSDFFAGLVDAADLGEYYREPGLSDEEARALLLDDTILPAGLTDDERREACRALKGSMLRREVYALDGTDREIHPYVVTEQNLTVRLLQPRATGEHAVFFVHPRENLSCHYERNPADPRVAHTATLSVDEYGNVLQSVSIAYGRRAPDAALLPDEQLEQARLLMTLTDNSVTNAIDTDDEHRTPVAAESRLYELTGPTPSSGGRFGFDEVVSAVDAAAAIPYQQDTQPGRTEKRLIEHTCVRYRPDDLGASAGDDADALLPAGVLEPRALPGDTFTLAFPPGLADETFGGRIDVSRLAGEGGYVDAFADGAWWRPAGRTRCSPATEDGPSEELAYARRHFYTVRRLRDPFGHETAVTLDGYDLLPVETRDALGNVTAAVNDYRVLQPRLITDANGNQSEAAFDALGLVAGTAAMGKPGEPVGDTLAGFEPDLPEDVLLAHLDDPRANPTAILLGATTRLLYDVLAYQRTRDAEQPAPAATATLARETHGADLEGGSEPRIQHGLAYSDGFGREIQQKRQAEPGPVEDGGGEVDRWISSGWTVFDNKGQAVRRFEPFFTATHRFEADARRGVSSILRYDPMGRPAATIHPDHTWQKVVYGPWRQETWDVNDTARTVNPAEDVNVGDFFARLTPADYLPTWRAARIDGDLGAEERAAALQADVHAGTPTITHADTLGRTFLTIVHNARARSGAPPDEPPDTSFQRTRVVLDIQGRERAVVDPLDRTVVRREYDMTGAEIHSASMDAGERWRLTDAAGAAIRSCDSRGHTFRTEYDALRRPVRTFVTGGDPARSDPRVLERDVLCERREYGETHPDPAPLNLRGRLWRTFDGAGLATSDAYDFKGNPLEESRQLARDYKDLADWSGAVPLEAAVYTSRATFDALNRPVSATSPDGTIVRPSYNEAGLLERLEVNVRGESRDGQPVWTPFLANVDYNARRQRERVAYGNGVVTAYTYDPLTFRTVRLVTRRDSAAFPDDCPATPSDGWPGCAVQNLGYTYDPAGNITHIQDDAQQAIYFRNQRVDASSDYVYDATYQLVEASGREHLGQQGGIRNAPAPPEAFDGIHAGLLQPGNGTAMGRYVERYVYDAAANLLSMQHVGSDPVHPGWTRTYAYRRIECDRGGRDRQPAHRDDGRRRSAAAVRLRRPRQHDDDAAPARRAMGRLRSPALEHHPGGDVGHARDDHVCLRLGRAARAQGDRARGPRRGGARPRARADLPRALRNLSRVRGRRRERHARARDAARDGREASHRARRDQDGGRRRVAFPGDSVPGEQSPGVGQRGAGRIGRADLVPRSTSRMAVRHTRRCRPRSARPRSGSATRRWSATTRRDSTTSVRVTSTPPWGAGFRATRRGCRPAPACMPASATTRSDASIPTGCRTCSR